MTTSMRLNVQHRNIRSEEGLDSWVEEQVRSLGECRQIDEANVRIAWLENASPAYEVQVHLVTPGPDVFAESRDHTVRAAFSKAMTQLRDQIDFRATKREQRLKGNLKARRAG